MFGYCLEKIDVCHSWDFQKGLTKLSRVYSHYPVGIIILSLYPRDKEAMLEVETIVFFFREEFT